MSEDRWTPTCRRLWYGLTVTCAWLAFFAAPSDGQSDTRPGPDGRASIAGTVTDALAERPLSGAEVALIERGIGTLSREDGSFVLRDLEPGRDSLIVHYLGLTSHRIPVRLRPDSTIRVEFEVVSPPYQMAALLVKVERVGWGPLAGFEHRRTRGRGVFFGRERIEREDPLVPSDLLAGIPGVRLGYPTGAAADRIIMMGHGPNRCLPLLFINGTPVHAEFLDDYLPELIEAIEVYTRPQDRPQQFRRGGCGAIVMWTRETRG